MSLCALAGSHAELLRAALLSSLGQLLESACLRCVFTNALLERLAPMKVRVSYDGHGVMSWCHYHDITYPQENAMGIWLFSENIGNIISPYSKLHDAVMLLAGFPGDS